LVGGDGVIDDQTVQPEFGRHPAFSFINGPVRYPPSDVAPALLV
jgi:hypothetical protein